MLIVIVFEKPFLPIKAAATLIGRQMITDSAGVGLKRK
jgi:hypothetical protein